MLSRVRSGRNTSHVVSARRREHNPGTDWGAAGGVNAATTILLPDDRVTNTRPRSRQLELGHRDNDLGRGRSPVGAATRRPDILGGRWAGRRFHGTRLHGTGLGGTRLGHTRLSSTRLGSSRGLGACWSTATEAVFVNGFHTADSPSVATVVVATIPAGKVSALGALLGHPSFCFTGTGALGKALSATKASGTACCCGPVVVTLGIGLGEKGEKEG